MLNAIQKPLQSLLLRFEGWFDSPFGPEWNPLRHLGALSFFFFWIVLISGIYVYIFFETSVAGAHQSLERLTQDQWYLGGVMRSLHRYGSDAMVITVLLHLGREFIMDHHRGVRWFSWFSGVPILWLLYASGIGGFWLAWDRLAQYLIVNSSEWLDWLGIFGEPLANNFLTSASLGDRFFSLLLFFHVAFPLFLLFASWIHLAKISRPRVNPPRGLAVGTLCMLIALSLIKPVTSQAPADLDTLPGTLNFDWFFAALYPVLDAWGPAVLWAIVVGGSIFIAALSWLPKLKARSAAEVSPSNCNGCSRCYADCPFGAVTMAVRTDGRPFPRIAVVNPDTCTACGICVGACPTSTPFRSSEILVTGIDLPDFRLGSLRERVDTATARLANSKAAEGRPRIAVFGCDHGIRLDGVTFPNAFAVRLPCIGMLPPAFIDYVLARGKADGVLLTGCREGDCFHRFGIRWTSQRLTGDRDPYLRKRVPRERIRTHWGAVTDSASLQHVLREFESDLAALDRDSGGAALSPAPSEFGDAP